jgi:flagellar motor component MotA
VSEQRAEMARALTTFIAHDVNHFYVTVKITNILKMRMSTTSTTNMDFSELMENRRKGGLLSLEQVIL